MVHLYLLFSKVNSLLLWINLVSICVGLTAYTVTERKNGRIEAILDEYEARIISDGSLQAFQNIVQERTAEAYSPQAAFQVANVGDIYCEDEAVTFINQSMGRGQIVWRIAGPSTPITNGDTIHYVFSQPGTYAVSLTIRNSFGEHSSTKFVTIIECD